MSSMVGENPNTEVLTLVSPGVKVGIPSDAGINVTPSIQELKDTPSVWVGADTLPLVNQEAIIPADEGVWTFSPVNVR